jgi:hypothetical protein
MFERFDFSVAGSMLAGVDYGAELQPHPGRDP